MTDAFETRAERQSAKAAAEGKFTGLEGEGQPLPDRSALAHFDIGTQVGHRIMAEAEVLARKATRKRALDAARNAAMAQGREGRTGLQHRGGSPAQGLRWLTCARRGPCHSRGHDR